MAEMVRKQIYIAERHERLLKRISKARGVSEAEFIRQAIEREAIGGKSLPLTPDQSAWDEISKSVVQKKDLILGLPLFDARSRYGMGRQA